MKLLLTMILAVAGTFTLATLPAGLISTDHAFEIAGALTVIDIGVYALSYVTPMGQSNAYGVLTLTKIFMKELTANFYKDNGFISQSKNDTPFVQNGKSVHLPQRGARPEVVRDLNEFPATITKRVDTEETYNLKQLYVKPIHIEDAEELEVVYAKRDSIREDIEMELKQVAAQNILELWMPTSGATILATTGADRAAGYIGASGNRKATTRNDFVRIAEMFDKDDLPQAGRNLMIPASFMSDVRKLDEFMSMEKIGTANLIEGQIGKVFGMNIFTRSGLVPYKADSTKLSMNNKGVYSITAATVKDAAFAWHNALVRHALGTVKININVDAPGMYGTVLDGYVRFGGRPSRGDSKGTYVLVEG